MDTKHTPTPWHFDEFQERIDCNELWDADTEKTWLAQMHDGPRRYADAAFIVRAVNTHDKALAALKRAKQVFDEMAERAGIEPDPDTPYANLCAVIAEMEGR